MNDKMNDLDIVLNVIINHTHEWLFDLKLQRVQITKAKPEDIKHAQKPRFTSIYNYASMCFDTSKKHAISQISNNGLHYTRGLNLLRLSSRTAYLKNYKNQFVVFCFLSLQTKFQFKLYSTKSKLYQ